MNSVKLCKIFSSFPLWGREAGVSKGHFMTHGRCLWRRLRLQKEPDKLERFYKTQKIITLQNVPDSCFNG